MSEDESTVEADSEESALLLERPVDKVNPEFFLDIVEEYVTDESLRSGMARLTVENGEERRFVVADELSELSDNAYVGAEIAELISLFERDDELLDRPVELSIPVADADRVVEEAQEEGTVTVMFEPEGVQTLLEGLLQSLDREDRAVSDD